MHAANMKSDRLRRVRNFLKDKKPHSTLEIIKKAKVCAVSSIIAELRCNGFKINCERKLDRWYYTLV
jgi:hypothetical protein